MPKTKPTPTPDLVARAQDRARAREAAEAKALLEIGRQAERISRAGGGPQRDLAAKRLEAAIEAERTSWIKGKFVRRSAGDYRHLVFGTELEVEPELISETIARHGLKKGRSNVGPAMDHVCPGCSGRGPFRVRVEQQVWLQPKGRVTAADVPEPWDMEEVMTCGQCGHENAAMMFLIPGLDDRLG